MHGKHSRLWTRWLVSLAAVAAMGCNNGGKEPATETTPAAQEQAAGGGEISAEARAEAENIFKTRCTPCHGPQGEGNGPASAGLNPKPRNFTNPEWQQSVTDEHIAKIIQYGGAAVGKAPTMPANPDLTSKPDVVQGLVEHVRGLKK